MASPLVDTALVAVHRLIVVQAAGTDAPAHPLDMSPVVVLVDTLPDRADTVAGTPLVAFGWSW